MTNFEFYKEDILKIAAENSSVALINGNLASCSHVSCRICDFSDECHKKMFAWLYAEHIEKTTLNKYERALCEALQTGWIARDKDGGVYGYKKKPAKSNDRWEGKWIGFSQLMMYNSEIKFDIIKWEDKEPWSIEELLKLEVGE